MTTRAFKFFSFSSLRWWGSPQKQVSEQWLIDQKRQEVRNTFHGVAWKWSALTRGVEGQPQRIERIGSTAACDWLRVSVRAERATK